VDFRPYTGAEATPGLPVHAPAYITRGLEITQDPLGDDTASPLGDDTASPWR